MVDRENEAASLRAAAAKLDALSDIDEADVDEMVQEFDKLRKSNRRVTCCDGRGLDRLRRQHPGPCGTEFLGSLVRTVHLVSEDVYLKSRESQCAKKSTGGFSRSGISLEQ